MNRQIVVQHRQARVAPAATGRVLQRTCECRSYSPVAGDECGRTPRGLQRIAVGNQRPAVVPAIVREVLRSPGEPLDAASRAFFEPRFGYDLSHVRVHTDTHSAKSSSAVNALAYAVGRDIVFGEGQFAPQTAQGRHLLAHELTHTLQQGGSASPSDEIAVPADARSFEQEADEIAAFVISGKTKSPVAASLAGPILQKAGFGELRVAEARHEEEERIKSGCPVKNSGTLSNVSWGETSGLYPTRENKYQPDKWDSSKVCELLRMRGAVHAVGQRGESVHRAQPGEGAIEQKLRPFHLIDNFLSLDPEIADPGVKWLYLSTRPDKPETHPGTTGTTRVKTYGSFYNIGGGDVPAGDVYVHFYKLKS